MLRLLIAPSGTFRRVTPRRFPYSGRRRLPIVPAGARTTWHNRVPNSRCGLSRCCPVCVPWLPEDRLEPDGVHRESNGRRFLAWSTGRDWLPSRKLAGLL